MIHNIQKKNSHISFTTYQQWCKFTANIYMQHSFAFQQATVSLQKQTNIARCVSIKPIQPNIKHAKHKNEKKKQKQKPTNKTKQQNK